MTVTQWIDFLQVGTNLALLTIAVSLTRKFTRVELKVDTMWDVFVKRFGVNGDKP